MVLAGCGGVIQPVVGDQGAFDHPRDLDQLPIVTLYQNRPFDTIFNGR